VRLPNPSQLVPVELLRGFDDTASHSRLRQGRGRKDVVMRSYGFTIIQTSKYKSESSLREFRVVGQINPPAAPVLPPPHANQHQDSLLRLRHHSDLLWVRCSFCDSLLALQEWR
jgi:hypothetical protein